MTKQKRKTPPSHDKVVSRVTNFLTQELKRNEDVSIFRNPDGTYDLFNRFTIRENQRGNYSVWEKNGIAPIEFVSLKNAVSWCILTAQHKVDKAKRVEHIDGMLAGIEASIVRFKTMIKRNTNLDSTLVYLAKLSQDQSQKSILTKELASHINSSKYIQRQRFIKGSK